MSFFSDNLDFEKFFLKDSFDKIKDEPLAALLGGLDPFGAAIWKGLGVLPKDYEPVVNVLGGPFGGGKSGLGDTGGAFGRFSAQGGDPSAAAGTHNAAEAIAASYALQGLGGLLGGETGAQVAPQVPGLLGGGQSPDTTAQSAQLAQQREAQKRRSLLNRRRF